MYIHMQGNSKLTPLNFANILGGSNILVHTQLNPLKPITKRELEASSLLTDDSVPGPQARLKLKQRILPLQDKPRP